MRAAVLALVLLAGCSCEDDEPELDAGGAAVDAGAVDALPADANCDQDQPTVPVECVCDPEIEECP